MKKMKWPWHACSCDDQAERITALEGDIVKVALILGEVLHVLKLITGGGSSMNEEAKQALRDANANLDTAAPRLDEIQADMQALIERLPADADPELLALATAARDKTAALRQDMDTTPKVPPAA